MFVTVVLFSALLAQAAAAPARPADDPLLAPLPAAGETVASFDEVLGALRRGSDTLAIAAARARVAAAQSREALAGLLPLVQSSIGVHHDLLNPDVPPLGAGAGAAAGMGSGRGTPTTPLGVGQLSARVPLIDVRRWQARAAARAGADAADASLADAERTLVLALADTLIGVLAAERAATLTQAGLAQALAREHLVTRTLELGTGTRLDLVRAQQDTRLARGDVILARERAVQAREALAVLLGRTRPVGVAASVDLETFFAASQRLCRIVATAERPDVVAARLRHAASRELVDAARAEYFPALSLQSTTSALTVDPGPLRLPSWTIAAILDVPIWDGGGRGARLDEQRFTADIAGREATLAAREADVDRARSRRGVDVARALATEAQAARDLADEADRMTRRSFEVGAATSLELVQSAQLLRQAELALAARHFESHTARFAALISEATCDIQ